MSSQPTFSQTLDYLYSRLPMFQRLGPAAFKKDLTNTIALCEALGNPHSKFKSIHIAGTNGKGSVSHMLASILQEAGFKTGLYTSPHLVDFRERIRINGEMIPENVVIEFVEKMKPLIENIEPSFFELTVAMAFDHFAANNVDIAVVETGLGGRLDSTNVITPLLSIVTNISYDHQSLLGNTLKEIALEKAGIIKQRVPVLIGKKQSKITEIFVDKAKELSSDISFTEDKVEIIKQDASLSELKIELQTSKSTFNISSPLAGDYQSENISTVIAASEILNHEGIRLPEHAIEEGIKNVVKNTVFRGRWELIQSDPKVICDVAHNRAGLEHLFKQVSGMKFEKLRVVFGMVKDKSIDDAINLLPASAQYYFCSPAIPRGLPVQELTSAAITKGFDARSFSSVNDALTSAISEARLNDLIIVTGSIFVVAEVLANHPIEKPR